LERSREANFAAVVAPPGALLAHWETTVAPPAVSKARSKGAICNRSQNSPAFHVLPVPNS